MDILPGVPLPLALVLLALVDSVSVGTLLIPIFFLVAPGRVRARRMLLYLFTVAGFYLVVGVLFLLGLVNLVDIAGDFFASTPGIVLRLIVGAGLLAAGIWIPSGSRSKQRIRASSDAGPRPSRLSRWRARLTGDGAAPAVVGVALAAGVLEVATMVPYILGMTMLADARLPLPVQITALGVYSAVMILPALVMLALRITAARAVEAPLQKLAGWLERTAAENTSSILAIAGFLIARSAASQLGLFTLF